MQIELRVAHVVSAFRAVASTSPESTRVPGMLRQVLLVVGISASLIALNVVLQNRPAGRHAASSPGAPLASHAGAGADAAEVTQLRQELRERNARISELERITRSLLANASAEKRQVEKAPTAARPQPAAGSQRAAPSRTPNGAALLDSELVRVPAGEPFPASLRGLPRGSDLFISFSSKSMAPFALNWVANLRKAGVEYYLVGALDEQILSICNEQGIPTLPLDGTKVGSNAANFRFDYSAYKRMAALKVAFYMRILRMGFNIWACDADTGWMGDPSTFVKAYPMQYAGVPWRELRATRVCA